MWSIAELAASQVAAPQWASVVSYNAQDHTAKVQIFNGPLTDELPIAFMGGMRYAPKNGQQAFLTPESQDSQALVISGFAFTDLAPPPTTPNAVNGAATPLQQGEWESLGTRGTNIRLAVDGSLFINSPTGHNIQADITSSGLVNHAGNVTHEKNTSIGTGFTGCFTTSTGEIVSVFNGIITNVA